MKTQQYKSLVANTKVGTIEKNGKRVVIVWSGTRYLIIDDITNHTVATEWEIFSAVETAKTYLNTPSM